MQVYKTFFKIAKAHFKSTVVYLIVFLVLAVLMSLVSDSDNSSRFEISSVDICVIDEDQSTASLALYDYLCTMHTPVTFDSYDNETLQDNLYYQNISYVLRIPEGFEEDLLSGGTNALPETAKRQDSASGYFVDQQIDNYIRALSLCITVGAGIDEAVRSVNDAIAESPEVTSVQFDEKSSGEKTQMYYFFQYLPYVVIMILLEGFSPILITFNRKDLGDRINCSSLDIHAKNVQIGLGCITYSLMIWITFIVLAVVMYGPTRIFSKNGLLCILNSFVFILIATAIALIIGSFVLNNNILSMIANVLGLGMSFLCGIFVPQYLLGEKVLMFSRFLPAYWNVRITCMLAGFSDEPLSMDTYWMCMGVQLLFFAAIFCIYLAFSRQKKRVSPA